MTGVLALLARSGTGAALSVFVNDVTRVAGGPASSGTVTTVQLPNTSVLGGIAPYSYSWTYESGSFVPVPSSLSAPNPTWSGEVSEGVGEVAVWRLTVTDSALATVEASINISLNWINFG